MHWYLAVLKKYAVFDGRARRREYWMFALFQLIFFTAAAILDNVFHTTMKGEAYGLFYWLYALATLLPNLGVTVRRLHDVGRSGWFILIGLIPIIGAIWILILMCRDGDQGQNDYGQDPKDNVAEVIA